MCEVETRRDTWYALTFKNTPLRAINIKVHVRPHALAEQGLVAHEGQDGQAGSGGQARIVVRHQLNQHLASGEGESRKRTMADSNLGVLLGEGSVGFEIQPRDRGKRADSDGKPRRPLDVGDLPLA